MRLVTWKKTFPKVFFHICHIKIQSYCCTLTTKLCHIYSVALFSSWHSAGSLTVCQALTGRSVWPSLSLLPYPASGTQALEIGSRAELGMSHTG